MSVKTCPHCGSVSLFTEPRPPHIALLCRDCGRWIKWVSKSQPASPEDKVSTDQCTCRDDIEKINRQLTVLTRAILNLGSLQGKNRPEIHISDELVNELVDTLMRNEAAR
jgi:hypothetical protein